jgi:hypothetical protein
MAESTTATVTAVAVSLLLILPVAMSSELFRCTKPELGSCYCGKTTYDRQELYAVNCTGTELTMKQSLDVLMNLPNETEVSQRQTLNCVLAQANHKPILVIFLPLT